MVLYKKLTPSSVSALEEDYNTLKTVIRITGDSTITQTFNISAAKFEIQNTNSGIEAHPLEISGGAMVFNQITGDTFIGIPDVGKGYLYLDTDGNLYYRDDGGIDFLLGGPNITINSVFTAGDTIATHKFVYLDATTGLFKKATAGDSTRRNTIGVITDSVVYGDTVEVTKIGKVNGFSGLTAGMRYYLGDSGNVVTYSGGDTYFGRTYVGLAYSTTGLDLNLGEPITNNITFSGLNTVLSRHGGNIGMGTTDIEAWHTTWRALEWYGSAIMGATSSSTLYFCNNLYYDGAWKLKKTGAGSFWIQQVATGDTCIVAFVSTPTGTGDTTIASTVRMPDFKVVGSNSSLNNPVIIRLGGMNVTPPYAAYASNNRDSYIYYASDQYTFWDESQNAFCLVGPGNYGIGITDVEAWNSSYRALEWTASSIMAGYSASPNETIYINTNLYYDGAWKLKGTKAGAFWIQQVAAGDTCYVAFVSTPTGTGDTTIGNTSRIPDFKVVGSNSSTSKPVIVRLGGMTFTAPYAASSTYNRDSYIYYATDAYTFWDESESILAQIVPSGGAYFNYGAISLGSGNTPNTSHSGTAGYVQFNGYEIQSGGSSINDNMNILGQSYHTASKYLYLTSSKTPTRLQFLTGSDPRMLLYTAAAGTAGDSITWWTDFAVRGCKGAAANATKMWLGGAYDVDVGGGDSATYNRDGYVYFAKDAYLKWSEAGDSFSLSKNLTVSGKEIVTGYASFGDSVNITTKTTLGGVLQQQTKFIRQVIAKTVGDSAPTGVFSITTNNGGGTADGGAYVCRVWGIATANATSGSTAVSSRAFMAQFARSMRNTGVGVCTAVTEIDETLSASTASATRDITGITLTVSETSEYVVSADFAITSTGSSARTLIITLVVDVFYTGFTVAPYITVL